MGFNSGLRPGSLALAGALALTCAVASLASAQAVSRESCRGRTPVAAIGISGIECDCTISAPGSGRAWSFRTAPKVTSLEMDSPAGRLLKPGDVITHVNGKATTTRDGAQELAGLRAGEPVILTVRRNGVQQTFAMTPEAACPTDAGVLGLHAPARPGSSAASARAAPSPAQTPRTSQTPRPAQTPRAAQTPQPSRAPQARSAYAVVPRGSFGMGLSCRGSCTIKIVQQDNVAVMQFSQPPDVYSIERDGPADRAGLRRGDVLTHIDGKPLDSPEGGRLFANAEPGQKVKITFRRGSERKTVTVQVAQRGTPAPQLTKSSESLERARASLSELQKEQAEQMRKIQEELRSSQKLEEVKLREMQRVLLEQEREHRTKLAQLAAELERADKRMRAAADSARAACPVSVTGLSSSRASRTLRYTGTIGDTEIEVRGPDRVSVTESGDEIEIATAGTVVKIKAAKKK